MSKSSEKRSPRRIQRPGASCAALLLPAALGMLAASGALAGEIREDPHGKLFAEESYPSASKCATCHPTIYREWASSNHAYSSISPMFHKFEQKINDLSQGTIGYFCMRCHASVGTTLKEPRDLPLWERAQVSREGVTCVSCHRVKTRYNKVNGERRIEPGNIHAPVYGPFEGDGVAEVVENKRSYKVKTSPDDRGIGQPIHTKAIEFEQITRSSFCTSCHQVAVHPQIKLEVVVEQYRASPAFKDGVTCQECHMGKVPGKAEGFATGPAAIVGGKVINPNRRHANHNFYGPGYTIAHPGIFPHNPRNVEFSIEQWLAYDHRSGWGTDAFEDAVARGEIDADFPEEWDNVDDRYIAREIVEENLELLREKLDLRREVMENGGKVEGPFFTSDRRTGKSLDFYYEITNTNPGHNLPSGSLGAQPELWANVALIDPDGNTIWESGYVDKNGDMADLHSLEVAAGTIEHDDQLFNLQTKFLTTNVKGTDREMYLPVNLDIDQLPFIRPGGVPVSVLNHPPFIRMEGHSLPPLGTRKASYEVPGKLLDKKGTYQLAFRMRSRAEPIYFMRFVGATSEMEQAMNEWMLDVKAKTVEFEVR